MRQNLFVIFRNEYRSGRLFGQSLSERSFACAVEPSNAATVSLRLFNFVKFEMKPLVLSMNYHRSIYGAVVLFIAGSTSAIAESGIASIYAYSGSKTASGERANPTGLTAAHRTLAFGTHVRVTNRR